jgi:hypothetical protein
MPFDPLKAEDLNLINRLLPKYPDFRDTISVINLVTKNAKYPINSFEDLANAMGGDNATITFRGKTMTMADARSVIPAYYFPIASETDLVAKVGDLAKALPPIDTSAPVRSPIESVIKLIEATATKPTFEIKQIDVDEVMRLSGGKATPALGGIAKS